MPWLPLHTGLVHHPKLIKAAALLSIPSPTLLGHLICLWSFAFEYVPSGDLSTLDPSDIASAAQWSGDPDAFVKALQSCGRRGQQGFLNENSQLHDWGDYGGKSITEMNKGKEAVRRFRERLRNDDVSITPPLRNDVVTDKIRPKRQDLRDKKEKNKNPLSPPLGGNSHEKVTSEFIDSLITEYSATFGGEQNVRDLITDAMNHKAIDKAKSQQVYLTRWLQRDARKMKAGGIHGVNGNQPQQTRRPGPFANYGITVGETPETSSPG